MSTGAAGSDGSALRGEVIAALVARGARSVEAIDEVLRELAGADPRVSIAMRVEAAIDDLLRTEAAGVDPRIGRKRAARELERVVGEKATPWDVSAAARATCAFVRGEAAEAGPGVGRWLTLAALAQLRGTTDRGFGLGAIAAGGEAARHALAAPARLGGPYRSGRAEEPAAAMETAERLDAAGLPGLLERALDLAVASSAGSERARDELVAAVHGILDATCRALPKVALAEHLAEVEEVTRSFREVNQPMDFGVGSVGGKPRALELLDAIVRGLQGVTGFAGRPPELVRRVADVMSGGVVEAEGGVVGQLAAELRGTAFTSLAARVPQLERAVEQARAAADRAEEAVSVLDRLNILWDSPAERAKKARDEELLASGLALRKVEGAMFGLFDAALETLPVLHHQMRLHGVRALIEEVAVEGEGVLRGTPEAEAALEAWAELARVLLAPLPTAGETLEAYARGRLDAREAFEATNGGSGVVQPGSPPHAEG